MEIIYALWLRQIKRNLRTRASLIGVLVQPLLFLLSFGGGLSSIFSRAGAGNYSVILVPGVIAMTILFSGVYSGAELMWDRKFGFIKETMVAPAPKALVILGRTLGGATVASCQGLFVLLVSVTTTHYRPPLAGLCGAFTFILLIALVFTCFGTAVAGFLTEMPSFQVVINVLVMPIYFLAGSLFPLDNLPRYLIVITRMNPLTYGVDGLRSCLSGSPSTFGLAVDGFVMLASLAVLMTLGVQTFRRSS